MTALMLFLGSGRYPRVYLRAEHRGVFAPTPHAGHSPEITLSASEHLRLRAMEGAA